jgi:hypothetical protein
MSIKYILSQFHDFLLYFIWVINNVRFNVNDKNNYCKTTSYIALQYTVGL